jgi:hypothetical protein
MIALSEERNAGTPSCGQISKIATGSRWWFLFFVGMSSTCPHAMEEPARALLEEILAIPAPETVDCTFVVQRTQFPRRQDASSVPTVEELQSSFSSGPAERGSSDKPSIPIEVLEEMVERRKMVRENGRFTVHKTHLQFAGDDYRIESHEIAKVNGEGRWSEDISSKQISGPPDVKIIGNGPDSINIRSDINNAAIDDVRWSHLKVNHLHKPKNQQMIMASLKNDSRYTARLEQKDGEGAPSE